MAAVQLTKKELLYLTALKGADNVWGVDDPFQGEKDADIRADVLEMQSELIRKTCLEASENGQFTVSSPLSELMDVCIGCERILVLNSSRLAADGTNLRFFIRGDSAVRFESREEATLEPISIDLLKSETKSYFGDGSDEKDPSSLVTSVARLRRMGSLSRKRFLMELKNCGCEDDLALIIADGLQGNPEFCSLLAFDRRKGLGELSGKVVTLNFSGGGLMVTPGGDMNTVCFTRVNHERLMSALNAVFGIREEVDVL